MIRILPLPTTAKNEVARNKLSKDTDKGYELISKDDLPAEFDKDSTKDQKRCRLSGNIVQQIKESKSELDGSSAELVAKHQPTMCKRQLGHG